jgi:hypothetical protein
MEKLKGNQKAKGPSSGPFAEPSDGLEPSTLAAGAKGGRRRRIDDLLQEAHRYRETFANDVPRTPSVEKLQPRLHALLLLLLFGEDSVTAGDVVLKAFAFVDQAGELTFDLDGRFPRWSNLLRFGYDEGYETFAATSGPSLRDVKQQIERTVRNVAAELVAGGAEVRGLSSDTIPMIAFAFLHAQIPMGSDAAASPVSADRVNDSLLRIADAVAAMPAAERPVFIDLYRLALLLGVSQGYAEHLDLATLSLG